MSLTKSISHFVDDTLIDLGRQFRWTYLPPLMIYVAARISGLTGIVGVFFIKDYLNSSLHFDKLFEKYCCNFSELIIGDLSVLKVKRYLFI